MNRLLVIPKLWSWETWTRGLVSITRMLWLLVTWPLRIVAGLAMLSVISIFAMPDDWKNDGVILEDVLPMMRLNPRRKR